MNPHLLAPALLAALLLAAPAPEARKKTRKATAAPQLLDQTSVTDADIDRLLQNWAVFDRAMGSLHDAVPPISADGGADASIAEAAWASDRRIRAALEEAGTTPEDFLLLYRRIATAWWELAEAEARADAAAAMRREIDALRATKDEDAKDVLAELERGLASLEKPAPLSRGAIAVQRHREKLAKLFSPEAPPAP